MKPISDQAALAATKRYASPTYLLEIEFTRPTRHTLRFSDAPRTALGHDWHGFVLDWGAVEEALNATDLGGRAGTLEVVLRNNKPVEGDVTGHGAHDRLSDLIRTPLNSGPGTYEWAFAKVTVYQLFQGLDSGDEVRLAVFYIEEPRSITRDRISLAMSDITLAIEGQIRLTKITPELFPDASPQALGKTIPALFGTVTDAPTLAAVAGAYSTLGAALTSTATTLELQDAETAARFPSGMFLVQIDLEVIRVGSRSGTTCSNLTRRFAGTSAAIHALGAGVFHLPQGSKAYRFIVGENFGAYKVRAVRNVRTAAGSKVGMTIDRAATDIVAGKSFAVINFPGVQKLPTAPVPPVTVKAGESPFSVTRLATNLPVVARRTWGSGAISVSASAVAIMQGLAVNNADVRRVRYTVTFTLEFGGPAGGTGGGNGLWSLRRNNGANVSIGGTAGGVLLYGSPSVPIVGTTTISFTTSAYENVGLTLANVITSGAFPGSLGIIITRVEAQVDGVVRTTTTSAPAKPPAPIGTSAADIIFGEVTCDFDGLEDDASGTITGTPGDLISNPADVTKLILLVLYPGTAASGFDSSFTTVRAALAALNLSWHFLLEPLTFSAFRAKVGEQSRAQLSLEGGLWHLGLWEFDATPQHTFDADSEVMRASLEVSRTPRSDVYNSVRGLCKPDWRLKGEERWGLTVLREELREDLDGNREERIQRDLILDWVRDLTPATGLVEFWLAVWRRQRARVKFTTWWNGLRVEKGDGFTISGDPILEAWGGTGLVFRVVERQYLIGSANPARIQVVGIEANDDDEAPADYGASGWPIAVE